MEGLVGGEWGLCVKSVGMEVDGLTFDLCHLLYTRWLPVASVVSTHSLLFSTLSFLVVMATYIPSVVYYLA